MAENNDNLDELLNDIALEPDNNSDDAFELENDVDLQNNNDSLEEINTTEEMNEESLDTEDMLSHELDEKEYEVQKKQTRIQKILIGVAAGLATVTVLGLGAYFLGVFDEEEVKVEEKPKVETVEKKSNFNFNNKDINVDRLNKKLNMLTKYEIIEDQKKEELKALEKERLHQEAQQKLEAERLAKIQRVKELQDKREEEERAAKEREKALLSGKKLKDLMKPPAEAPVKEENTITVIKEEKDITVSYETEAEKMDEKKVELPNVQIVEMEKMDLQLPKIEPIEVEAVMQEPLETMPQEAEQDEAEESNLENNFIKFIVITTNKPDIYKKELSAISNIDDRIQLCRDDSNNIEIFVGPYNDNQREVKLAVFNYALSDKIIEALDFTQEEFDKRCNY